MANGSDSTMPTFRQLVILCLSLTAGLNVPTYFILKMHAQELNALRTALTVKTADRYYRRDAETQNASHEKIHLLTGKAVTFRFERNEALIQQCLNGIERLKEDK